MQLRHQYQLPQKSSKIYIYMPFQTSTHHAGRNHLTLLFDQHPTWWDSMPLRPHWLCQHIVAPDWPENDGDGAGPWGFLNVSPQVPVPQRFHGVHCWGAKLVCLHWEKDEMIDLHSMWDIDFPLRRLNFFACRCYSIIREPQKVQVKIWKKPLGLALACFAGAFVHESM